MSRWKLRRNPCKGVGIEGKKIKPHRREKVYKPEWKMTDLAIFSRVLGMKNGSFRRGLLL